MLKNNLKIVLIYSLLFPLFSFAEVATIEKVNIEVQPLPNNQFQLFFKFDLPVLPKSANIDYAVLSVGMNVLEKSETKTMSFEILSKQTVSSEKVADYNADPVTALIPRNKDGLTQLTLEITQLVRFWVIDGAENEGIILVSHRNIPDKFLTSDKIALAPKFKAPRVKIFYTVLD